MRVKSIATEARQIQLAAELIRLGARLQLLECETQLSRERLLRLYKEIQGKSPPKGMLPFSTDWFMTWQPNVHASLFMNIFRYIDKAVPLERVEVLIRAYRLYAEQVARMDTVAVLSLTRAWRLLQFFDAGMLDMAECTRCGGRYVAHALDLHAGYVCGLCDMPSRAGKTRARPPAESRGRAAP